MPTDKELADEYAAADRYGGDRDAGAWKERVGRELAERGLGTDGKPAAAAKRAAAAPEGREGRREPPVDRSSPRERQQRADPPRGSGPART